MLLKEFSELMKYVCWASEGKLSSSANRIMDMLLTDGTKKLLIGSCLPYSVIAGIITNSVLEIESGSLETVDRLVRKGLFKSLEQELPI